MLLNNRHGSVDSDAYRYGFQGQERDDEVKGSGNSYDFGARMYDPRLMRWFAPDPLEGQFPMYSTYSFALNNPIIFVDPSGKAPEPFLFNKVTFRIMLAIAKRNNGVFSRELNASIGIGLTGGFTWDGVAVDQYGNVALYQTSSIGLTSNASIQASFKLSTYENMSDVRSLSGFGYSLAVSGGEGISASRSFELDSEGREIGSSASINVGLSYLPVDGTATKNETTMWAMSYNEVSTFVNEANTSFDSTFKQFQKLGMESNIWSYMIVPGSENYSIEPVKYYNSTTKLWENVTFGENNENLYQIVQTIVIRAIPEGNNTGTEQVIEQRERINVFFKKNDDGSFTSREFVEPSIINDNEENGG